MQLKFILCFLMSLCQLTGKNGEREYYWVQILGKLNFRIKYIAIYKILIFYYIWGVLIKLKTLWLFPKKLSKSISSINYEYHYSISIYTYTDCKPTIMVPYCWESLWNYQFNAIIYKGQLYVVFWSRCILLVNNLLKFELYKILINVLLAWTLHTCWF